MKASPKDVVDVQLRVLKHLPDGDLSLIVLKGHLLIEELLYRIVKGKVRHPESIDLARLSFFQVAQMARAVAYDEGMPNIWEPILAINGLRNMFAHDLDAADLEKNLRQFAHSVAPETPGAEKAVLSNPEKQIIDSVSFICGFLAAIAFP